MLTSDSLHLKDFKQVVGASVSLTLCQSIQILNDLLEQRVNPFFCLDCICLDCKGGTVINFVGAKMLNLT